MFNWHRCKGNCNQGRMACDCDARELEDTAAAEGFADTQPMNPEALSQEEWIGIGRCLLWPLVLVASIAFVAIFG